MKRQKSCGPRLGKSVHQLPEVVTFAYDLPFDTLNTSLEISIRGIQLLCEKHERNFHVAPYFPKKCCLGPQNGFESFRTRKTGKNSKLPKLPKKLF
jgi:hypothetical protein